VLHHVRAEQVRIAEVVQPPVERQKHDDYAAEEEPALETRPGLARGRPAVSRAPFVSSSSG